MGSLWITLWIMNCKHEEEDDVAINLWSFFCYRITRMTTLLTLPRTIHLRIKTASSDASWDSRCPRFSTIIEYERSRYFNPQYFNRFKTFWIFTHHNQRIWTKFSFTIAIIFIIFILLKPYQNFSQRLTKKHFIYSPA